MKKLSFIIPCYKSEHTVADVIGEVVFVVSEMGSYDYEIIAVNDHSPDQVMSVLEICATKNTKIKIIAFAKNFGQHAGIMAGIRYSTGDYLVILNDDGQCPLDKLPELLAPIEAGADVSIARYGKKNQSIIRNIFSMVNNFTAPILTGMPKNIQMGNFFAMNRLIAEQIAKYQGPYPYVDGLFFRASDQIVNVPMQERKRAYGRSTYTFRKLFMHWVSSLTAFSIVPLRFSSVIGAMIATSGLIYAGYIVLRRLVGGSEVTLIGWSSLMAAVLLLGGLVLFVLGIMGEYVGRIYMSIARTPQYVVSKTINFQDNQ